MRGWYVGLGTGLGLELAHAQRRPHFRGVRGIELCDNVGTNRMSLVSDPALSRSFGSSSLPALVRSSCRSSRTKEREVARRGVGEEIALRLDAAEEKIAIALPASCQRSSAGRTSDRLPLCRAARPRDSRLPKFGLQCLQPRRFAVAIHQPIDVGFRIPRRKIRECGDSAAYSACSSATSARTAGSSECCSK